MLLIKIIQRQNGDKNNHLSSETGVIGTVIMDKEHQLRGLRQNGNNNACRGY